MSRRNPCSRSAASQKVEEKVCFSFSSCWMPREGLPDHASVSKLYLWAKTNIKCSNRIKLACERPLLRRAAASNITSSAIADQNSSLLPSCTCSMHVAHSAVHRCAVLRRCVGLQRGLASRKTSTTRVRDSNSECTRIALVFRFSQS